MIDKLFLELSQVTKARTAREIALVAALRDLVGESDPVELRKMKEGLKMISAPASEILGMLNAIDVLIDYVN